MNYLFYEYVNFCADYYCIGVIRSECFTEWNRQDCEKNGENGFYGLTSWKTTYPSRRTLPGHLTMDILYDSDHKLGDMEDSPMGEILDHENFQTPTSLVSTKIYFLGICHVNAIRSLSFHDIFLGYMCVSKQYQYLSRENDENMCLLENICCGWSMNLVWVTPILRPYRVYSGCRMSKISRKEVGVSWIFGKTIPERYWKYAATSTRFSTRHNVVYFYIPQVCWNELEIWRVLRHGPEINKTN